MKILMVKPGIGDLIEGYDINDGRMEPLALGVLAGLTPDRHTVMLFDDRMERVPIDNSAELVAITVDSYSARRAYEIAGAFREHGVPVVLGGIHASLLPDEAASHADSVIVGDAEPVWGQVLDDCERRSLQARYRGEFAAPQCGSFPRRSLFEGKGYLPVSLIQYSRGCPFNCSYCSVAEFFGRNQYFRPVQEVIEEIKAGGLKMLLFVDDNITADVGRAKELFEALIPLGVKWASQASIDMIRDAELMDLMARSGCIGQLVGFESINPESLRWLNKGANLRDFDVYQHAVGVMRKYGFQTWASFIVGNDHDTPASIRETVDFAIRSKFTLAFFHMFSPYPGTPVYEQLEREGRLLFGGKWWLDPDYRYNKAAFVPRGMGPEELSRLVVEANQRFYSVGSIARRLVEPRTNLKSLASALFYLRYNWVLRTTSV